jgi:hypothetical protein
MTTDATPGQGDDMVRQVGIKMLSADPRAAPPEQIADLEVRATYLAGRQVYSQ